MENNKEKIVYIREHRFENYLGDLVTFGTLLGAFWFNYTFIDGNNFVDLLLFICFFFFTIARSVAIAKSAKEKYEEKYGKN